jgi:hypothetical protein
MTDIPRDAADNDAMLIYSEETCGRLLRRLNRLCVNALKSGNHADAKQAAELSDAVEEAMRYAGIK